MSLMKKKVTTIEYPVEDFRQLIKDTFYPGQDAKVEFVVTDISSDPFDRSPPHKEVTSVKITVETPDLVQKH